MQRRAIFLSQFKAIARRINDKPASAVTQLAELLTANPEFLVEDNETLNLFNDMADAVEQNYPEEALVQLRQSLTSFWRKIFLQEKIDIFFCGSKENAATFFSVMNKPEVNNLFFIHIMPEQGIVYESFSAQLAACQNPVVIYDHSAAEITKIVEIHNAVAVVDYQQLMTLQALPLSDFQDMLVSFLQHKHQQAVAKRPQTLILGSSYGYYAFPQNLLKKSVNLSMHSLDLRQALAMMNHYTDDKKIKNIVLMSGYFDVFYEISKTRMQANIHFLNIFSHYNHKNNILLSAAKNTDFLLVSDEELMASLIPLNRGNEKLLQYKQALDDEARQHQSSSEVEKIRQLTDFLPPEAQLENARHRAGLHNKLSKYQESRATNTRILHQMCALAKEKGIRIHYVIPPFPPAYFQSLDPQMVASFRQVLKSVESYHFTVHELQGDKSFASSDFRDGDHLNYQGAVKIVKLLKKRGLVL